VTHQPSAPSARDSQGWLQTHLVIGALSILSKFRGLILVVVMLRVFGASALGIWVQVTNALPLATGLAQAGLHASLVRYLPGSTHERRREIFWNGMSWTTSAALLVTLLMFATAPLLGAQLDVPVSLLRVGSLLVVPRTLNFFLSNKVRADGHGGRYALLDFIPSVTEIVAVGLAGLTKLSLEHALWIMLGLESVAMLGLAVHVFSDLPPARPSWRALEPLLRYSLPTIPLNIGTFVLFFADRYLIGWMLGPAAVGTYAAAYGLCQLPSLISKPLMTTYIPRAAGLWNRGERAQASALLRLYLSSFSLLAAPLALGLAVTGGPFLRATTGQALPEWSIGLFLSLTLGAFLMGQSQLSMHSYHLEERLGRTAALYLAASAVNVVANLLLIPHWGVLGAGIATTLGYLAAAIWAHVNTQRVLGHVLDLPSLLRQLSCAGAMAVLVAQLPMHGIGGLIAAVLAGGVVYTALVALFDREHVLGLWATVRRM
jgi:O-antigen/teichoic acid export membrane protein